MAGDLRPVRLAGIDIGTNTVLMLVADVPGEDVVVPVVDLQEVPRLGRDVDASGRIRESAFARLAGILLRYAGIARASGAAKIAACATSAVRNASNRGEFVGYILDQTGIVIEVIDGATEAELTFRGVAGRPGAGAGGRGAAVLDIGGGSTELCYAAGPGLTRISREIGSVRLAERFFRHTPPTDAEVGEARSAVLGAFGDVAGAGFAGRGLIAVAGTAVALAGLKLGLREFDRERIEGCRIGTPTLRRLAGRLLAMTPGEVRSLSNLTAGREDVLPAGALILSEFAGHFGVGEVSVSTRGLRYGIVLRERERIAAGAGPGG